MRISSGRARRRGLRPVVQGLLILTAFFSFMVVQVGQIPVALAADSVSMSAAVGFSGYFGKNEWVPVTVSIHHLGPAESAVLTVSLPRQSIGNDRLLMGTLKFPLELPKNGWTSQQIEVPGSVIDGNTTVSCDVAGRALAMAYLNGNAVGDVALVTVLSKQTQKAQFLTGSTSGANPVLAVSVNPDLFPHSANLLNGLTAVVASPTNLADLSRQQQEALLTWVKLGGQLLVTETMGASPYWQRYLPMAAGKNKMVQPDGLDVIANDSSSVAGTIATDVKGLTRGALLWASSDGVPLLASRTVGRGSIWQTSFSPDERPLLGWSGNPALWSYVFRQGSAQSDSAIVRLLDPQGVLSLAAASDALSPLRVPSLVVWSIVFLAYLLIVGPLAFFILRRYRRASWAWFVLPFFSGLTTLCIYAFGLTGRPPGLLNEGVGILELVGDGTAEAYGIQAYMSPYIGGLNFVSHVPMLALPLAEAGVSTAGSAAVTSTAHSTDILFQNVSRWNVRYVYAAGAVSGQGEVTTHLTSSFGMMFGTIENNTSYPLHHLALFWDGHMYEIGDLAVGQAISLGQADVNQATVNNWLAAYGDYNHDVVRGIGRPLGAFASTLGWSTEDVGGDDAMLLATTSTRPPSLPKLGADQDVASSQTVVLVRQFASVQPLGGGQFP